MPSKVPVGATRGDGYYQNPLLPGDYRELDAIRLDNDYYAISSTFQYSPGMVMLHSSDMFNWTILNHVVNDLEQPGPALNWNRVDCYGKG